MIASVPVVQALLFVVTYVTLRISSPSVGFTRDEGYYFKAGEQYVGWYRQLWSDLWSGQLLNAFSDATITRFFEYNHEHPALIKTMMGFTWWWTHEVLGITSNAEGFRVVGPLFAGITVACTFALGRRAGLGMCGALVMLWAPAVGRVPLTRADLLAASAGLAFARNTVMTRRITSLAVREKTYIAWLGVVVVSALMVLLWFPQVPQASAVAWWATIALGVFGFLLSTLAVVSGVTHMPVQRSAVIMLFELVVGAATAWWLAGELISLHEWVGGALILSAAMIAIFQEE